MFFSNSFELLINFYDISVEQLEKKKLENSLLVLSEKLKDRIQDLINFAIKIKYDDFSGYVTHDSLKYHFDEYVFFRNTLKCYAIISLNKDHFKVFYDYKSYIQYFSNIKYDEEFTIPNLNKQYEYVCEKIASEIKIDNKYNFYNSPRRDIKIVKFKRQYI